MVRPSYRANFTSGTGDSASPTADPFFGLVFDASLPGFSEPPSYDRDDLLGGYPAPRRYVGWQTFFDLGDGQVKNNKKIDTTISSVMFTLPVPAIAPHTQTSPTVLPQRNLLRQLTWGLPAGQAVARAMGADPLTAADLADIGRVYRRSPPAPRCGTTSSPKPRPPRTASTSARSAAGSSPRPSSGCCAPTPPATSTSIPRFRPFLGTDLSLGPTPDPAITGNRSYTRAHFLHYAGVVTPGTYR